MKKSIVFYMDSCELACNQLDDRELGEVFRALVSGVMSDCFSAPFERGTAQAAIYEIMSAQIKRDADRYADKCAALEAKRAKRSEVQNG